MLTSPNVTYPPGPQPYPFIGNLLDIPILYQERAFANLAKIYGISSYNTNGSRHLTNRIRGCGTLACLYEGSHYSIVFQGCTRVA